MHIEPGFIAPAKLVFANVTAVAVLAGHLKDAFRAPAVLLRTLLAAAFFSVFMESFHMPVGPSELHFVGAMAIYLTLGYFPTLYGFALGLLLQGLLFEPQDLVHLAVNSLSLIVPLLAVHHSVGKRLAEGRRDLSWKEIVRLDAVYYSGVMLMVGFWLAFAEVETPFFAWAKFAAAYAPLVLIEPMVTMSAVRLLKRWQEHKLVARCFDIQALRLAA
ncbi:energy-coupling factor ABC transporter permease [Candidatus Electronema sp. JM]|uniref:energy-coupling factor ABC transporter permease n=1 Tax=Candidatus Electronema sp. JM TaxID=3401571 RepID=UPI003AA8A907